ncbi:aminotransferase class V-fold PLP-dependent enzyme [Altererythrobacter aerius]|uniref:Cysteine desulfurase n=1 Tax=Tsuneonella aeria TaxID=1837929 RepID=A0A6I4TBA0_9SPHN|nr:cysteine desulfurase family protein [Tsuneonella aeria]MXO74512.1 aminotransferase class V-fold PLP-dependent enzyme [Tsuneonella aeria]
MIYLDYQATTPLAPEARDAMLRWLGGPDSDTFGNPHSPHRMGRMARAAIELARDEVAALFPPGGRVLFTGGATEAINLAIRGTPGDGTVAVSAIEHAAVLDTADAVGPAPRLAVTEDGICDPAQGLSGGTRLVCVMQVNNEIGTVQPVDQWAEQAKETGALLLCDAVQAYGKLAVAGADLVAISAHKFHGPKGVGALWVRNGVTLTQQQTGGGQEAGLRSGTLSPALIAGMGAAARVARERMAADAAHVEALWARAREIFAGWHLNGSAHDRWKGNLNLWREGLDVARLMSDCREVMFSAGSACASGSGRTSHVLKAIGLADSAAKSSIRLGFGRYTTRAELEEGASMIVVAADRQDRAA